MWVTTGETAMLEVCGQGPGGELYVVDRENRKQVVGNLEVLELDEAE